MSKQIQGPLWGLIFGEPPADRRVTCGALGMHPLLNWSTTQQVYTFNYENHDLGCCMEEGLGLTPEDVLLSYCMILTYSQLAFQM